MRLRQLSFLKGAKSEIVSPLGLLLHTACRPKQSVSWATPPSTSALHPPPHSPRLCSRAPQHLHGLLHPDGPGVSSTGSTSLSCPIYPLLLPTLTWITNQGSVLRLDPNGEPGLTLAGKVAEANWLCWQLSEVEPEEEAPVSPRFHCWQIHSPQRRGNKT